MGDKIIIESIEIIQGGLIQIYLYNETINKHEIAFCEPNKFFNLIGESMQKNHIARMELEGWIRNEKKHKEAQDER